MKIIRLKINEPFRSLQSGFEIIFRKPDEIKDLLEFHPFCLAGLNGSGKSNVLEALANIFFHLEGCANKFKPESFAQTFKPEIGTPDAYELAYWIKNDDKLYRVEITKEKGEVPKMEIEPFDEKMEGGRETPNLIAVIGKETAHGKSFLPELVVGYSSGENEILSLPFLKMRLFQYDEYLEAIDQKLDYDKPESSLVYIDYDMSQAVLLAILLFGDEETLKPLDTELGVKQIRRFRMNLSKHLRFDESYKGINPILIEQLAKYIDSLKDCATCFFENDKVLYLDYLVSEETKIAFKNHFDSAFELFQFFQISQILNYRTLNNRVKKDVYQSQGFYTDWKVSTPLPEDEVFNFSEYFILKVNKGEEILRQFLLKNLSDGEQQFLHTLGICLMLQNKNALLLLDEPETHFNPDWRSKFINILRKTLTAGGNDFSKTDIILTSHSPFIISDCLPNKVIHFKKENEQVIAENANKLDFKTFGASVDYILQRFFGVKSLVSQYSREWIKNVIDNGSDDQLKEAIEFVGESNLKQFLFSELYKRSKQNDNT